MSTSSSSPTRDTSDKAINKPDIYEGKRSDLEKWLYQVKLYFDLCQVPNGEKTKRAMTFMRGGAQEWIQPKYERYLKDQEPNNEDDDESDDDEDNEANNRIFTDFPTFEKEIRHIFGNFNDTKIAEKMVQSLKQKTSAASYSAEFTRYAEKTGWNDQALRTMYEKGLKDPVKDELMRYGGNTERLSDLIAAAIEVDDKLYERNLEKRNKTPNRNRAGFWTTGKVKKNSGKRAPQTIEYGEPMDIDMVTIRKEPEKSDKKKELKKNDKNCFACGKPGHFAKNCRSKNKVQRRQLGMATRVEEHELSKAMDSEDQILPVHQKKHRKYEINGRQVTRKYYIYWIDKVCSKRLHPDHDKVPQGKCFDPKCRLSQHEQPISNWDNTDEEISEHNLDSWEKITDECDKQLGNSKLEEQLPTKLVKKIEQTSDTEPDFDKLDQESDLKENPIITKFEKRAIEQLTSDSEEPQPSGIARLFGRSTDTVKTPVTFTELANTRQRTREPMPATRGGIKTPTPQGFGRRGNGFIIKTPPPKEAFEESESEYEITYTPEEVEKELEEARKRSLCQVATYDEEWSSCFTKNCVAHEEIKKAKNLYPVRTFYRKLIRPEVTDKYHKDHSGLHWTACYFDYCLTHLSGKQDGYYPTETQVRRELGLPSGKDKTSVKGAFTEDA
jgi:hypothetical protein